MDNIYTSYKRMDEAITNWMARYGILLLRLSLGFIFFWFGFLKFFAGISPAEDIAVRTIDSLTFGLIPPTTSILILATWESLIGIGLISGRFLRATLLLLFMQMLGTVIPLFLFPEEVFIRIPYVPTLEGQYIIKNLVLVSAGLVIGATVRGGVIITDPDTHRSV
ncbi:MAG: DoxX family membrane protein [Anaerolineales bacterium]|nr:DoxX family membrane protein [Anaerolineales bacterium]